MYGSTMGNLTVSKVKGGNSSVLYTKSGSQGKDWFDVMVDIPVDSSFQVSTPCGELPNDVPSMHSLGLCSGKSLSKRCWCSPTTCLDFPGISPD